MNRSLTTQDLAPDLPWGTLAPPQPYDVGFGNKGGLGKTEDIVILIFESLVILSILAGNILVIIAVAVSRRLKTITNYFVVSLAVSDLLVGILVLVTTITSHYPDLFELVLFCLLPFCFLFFTCIASVLNMLAIAIDRFIAISWPIFYIRKMSKSKAAISIAMAWAVAMALSIVTLFWNSTVQEKGILGVFGPDTNCNWSTIFSNGKSAITLVTSLGLFVPMVICFILYSRMLLLGQNSLKRSRSQSYLAKEQRKRARERTLTITLGIMVGAFAICWLPYIVLVNVELWCENECDLDPLLRLGFCMLGFANSSINPILYALRTDDFRYAYIKIFRMCLKRKFENRGSRSNSLSKSRKSGDSSISLSNHKRNHSQSKVVGKGAMETTIDGGDNARSRNLIKCNNTPEKTKNTKDAGVQTDE